MDPFIPHGDFVKGFLKESAFAAKIYRLTGKAARASGGDLENLVSKIKNLTSMHRKNLTLRKERTPAETLKFMNPPKPKKPPLNG